MNEKMNRYKPVKCKECNEYNKKHNDGCGCGNHGDCCNCCGCCMPCPGPKEEKCVYGSLYGGEEEYCVRSGEPLHFCFKGPEMNAEANTDCGTITVKEDGVYNISFGLAFMLDDCKCGGAAVELFTDCEAVPYSVLEYEMTAVSSGHCGCDCGCDCGCGYCCDCDCGNTSFETTATVGKTIQKYLRFGDTVSLRFKHIGGHKCDIKYKDASLSLFKI